MRPRPRVRLRLTAWYTGMMLALLSATVVAMRYFGREALYAEHQGSVDRSLALLRSFFRAELAEFKAVDITVAHITGELVFPGMEASFLRPDGRLFATTRRGTGESLAPPLREVDQMLDTDLAPGWRVHLKFSTAELESGRQQLDRLTLIALPLAVALAGLFGWLATGRALRPVGEMAAAAERIATDPAQRMPVADASDEFGRLGGRFNAVLNQLDAAMEQQRRFLTDAAHELRTPIARVLGDAESQLVLPPNTVSDRAALERIRGELVNTGGVVDELLQVARADAGAQPVDRTAFFLDDVVTEAIGAWQATASSHGQRLDLGELEESRLVGDRRLVRRLIDTLIDNALRYTTANGIVQLSVKHNGGVDLVVDDNGPGVPESDRRRIFERFYRSDHTRHLVPHGSGLGLAIAAWIATAHDATLVCETSPLGGARFRCHFPPNVRG